MKVSKLGDNVPHDSAIAHATGTSIYIDDRAPTQGELFVDVIGSPVAKGMVKNIDAAQAQKIPGFVAMYTAKDLPGKNLWGSIFEDQPLLATETNYYGEPIAVIAAENPIALRLIKKSIHVACEEISPILTIEQAIAAESFIGKKVTIKRGDVETVFNTAPHTLEDVFVNKGQEHFYLETQASLAYPLENGDIEVHASAQHPTEVQHVVAKGLGLKHHQVVCVVKRMGGGFGGKESQASHFAALTALVAHKTKHPSRLVLDRDTDMTCTGKRHGFRNYYKVAFDDNGVILALKVHFFSDGGSYADLSPAVLERALYHADNAYFLENALITGQVCRTNLPPNTAFRGFGGPQGIVVIENIIEDIAVSLKLDALEVRERNCYGTHERHTTPYGQRVENNLLPEILQRLKTESGYARRRKEVQDFNRKSHTHLKGLALTPVKFGISFTTTHLNQGNALVNVHLDGTVQVSTGATEMGQGVNTQIAQIVAQGFGISVEDVKVMPTSTEKNPNTSATAASAGTDLNASAALIACEKIKKRLANCVREHAAGQTMNFKDLVNLAYHNRISLGEQGFYKTPHIHIDKKIYQGRPFLYYTQGAAMSEVMIDRFTGETKVLAAHILMDLGRVINSGIAYGQTCGGYIQGMGWLTSEDLVFDDKGVLLSHSPTTYKIPNIQDTPREFKIDFMDNPSFDLNVGRSKASGEPPLLTAISVWAAIKNAIAHTKAGQVFKLNIPATPEEILMTLKCSP